jgi:putative flippase GtrA
VRYFFVGGLAFVADFIFLYLLTSKFGIYYLFSAAISFILGLIINYFLSKAWVFNRTVLKNKFAEFWFVALISVIGLLFNELFLWIFTDKAHIYYLFSKIISAGIVFWWNFLARKFTIFR